MICRAQSKIAFEQYFEDVTLRIDYYHTGNSATEEFTLDKIYRQGPWAGNPDHCLQPFEMGLYKVSVLDIASNRIIFTRGFNSIFAEYQTIEPAIRGIKRTYHESVLIPCPRRPFILILEKRDRYNLLSPVFKQVLDPADYHILNETYQFAKDRIIPVVRNGDPHHQVDLVILAEGYREEEFDRFKADLKYYTDLFFRVEPYQSRARQFNIHGIFSASLESGTDEPRQGIYKNTKLNSSFNAFDLDRYCLVEDNKAIRDMAAQVPYDAILIMVNKDRYGGGGIYNCQTVFNTGSSWRDYVFLHEFGHAFAGLADEYFSSPVSYVDFYTPGVEPLEANITALLDPDHVKWKKYLSPGIAVPTDWGKATYDSLNNRMTTIAAEKDRVIDSLQASGVSRQEIDKVDLEYQAGINRLGQALDDFFANHPLRDKVGVFEGANYMSTGIYRPTLMSLMHKFEAGNLSYGVVNEQAILSIIQYYTGD
jgi:hypothetical protein